MRLRPALPLTLAIAVVVAVGCQAGPTGPTTPTGAPGSAPAPAQMAPLSVRTGSVRVDGALLQSWLRPAARMLMTPAATPVVAVRLTAIGPGIAVAESTKQDFTDSGPVNGVKPPPAGLTLAVTPGLNRVFTLEGLDADGQVVRISRTLGGVEAGATSTLTINAGTDAAARTLEDLLITELRDATDANGLVASLATSDITAKLLAFVVSATGFDAASNVFTQPVAPLRFRDRELAKGLLISGRTVLDAAVGPTFLDEARAGLQLLVNDHGDPAQNVTLTLYTPGEPAAITSQVGTAIFYDVPPGRWVVRAQGNGKTAWVSVRTRDSETTEVFSVDLDPQGTGPTPEPAAANLGETLTPPQTTALVASTPFPSPGSLPYVVTFAGRLPPRNTINGLGAATDRKLSKVDFDANNNPFILQYGLALRVLANHTYEVIAKAGKAPFIGNDLVAMAVAPDATVYVADEEGRIFKCPAVKPPATVASAPVELATVVGTMDLALHPNGLYLYARSDGAVTKIDPATGATFPHGTVSGVGPLTCDGNGAIYAYSSDTQELWRVSENEPYTAAAFAGSGQVGVADGAPAVATFADPLGLDINLDTNIIYMADAGGNRIRAIDGTNGTVSTVAGGTIGYLDQATTVANGLTSGVRFNRPSSVAVRSGSANLMIADAGNARLRTVNLTAQTSTTTVNAFGQFGLLPGNGSAACFGDLFGLTSAGSDLLVADDANSTIWKIQANREAAPLYGNGLSFDEDGPGATSGVQVDRGRLASEAAHSDVFLKLNEGGLRVFRNGVGGSPAYPSAPFSDVVYAGNVPYALVNNGSSFSIYRLSPTSGETLLVASLTGSDAAYLQVRGTKAYVAFGGETGAHIEEMALSGGGSRRTVYSGGVHGLAIDPTGGHLYAIALSNCTILDINPVTATSTTLAGQEGSYAVIDGPKASARFQDLRSITLSPSDNNLYVTDGPLVRRIQRP